MGSLIKIDSTVISYNGIKEDFLQDNFYLNGRYRYDYEPNDIQISMDDKGENFVYGITKDSAKGEESKSKEIIKVLNHYSERVMNCGGDIDSKLSLLEQSVVETNNVFFSKSISNPNRNNTNVSFAGVIISNGKIAALNVGDCNAYLIRDGEMKQITNEYIRANKLMKLGIINKEQAKKVKGKKLKLSLGDDKVDTHVSESIKLKEEDVLLLSDDNFIESIDEITLSRLLKDVTSSRDAANSIVREVRKDFEKINNNMTIVVLKVDRITNSSIPIARIEDNDKDDWGEVRNRDRNRKRTSGKIIKAVAVTLIVIFGTSFLVSWLRNYVGEREGSDLIEIKDSEKSLIPDTVNDERDLSNKMVEYVVKEGDTIKSISKDFYNDETKYTLILEKNGMREEDIRVGQTIYLYPEDIINNIDGIENEEEQGIEKYTIKNGDTLGSISLKFYGTIAEYEKIKEHNNIMDEQDLVVGQVIEIPKNN